MTKKKKGQHTALQPTEVVTDKTGQEGGRSIHNADGTAPVGTVVVNPVNLTYLESGMQPNVLRHDWHVPTLDQTPNMRGTVTVHVPASTHHPVRVTNSRKVDCFRVSARVRATGALVFAEIPCAAGSPAVLFRDVPELEPHFPEPLSPTALPWLNTARYVSPVTIMATTLSRSGQRERERFGLPVEHPDQAPEDEPKE